MMFFLYFFLLFFLLGGTQTLLSFKTEQPKGSNKQQPSGSKARGPNRSKNTARISIPGAEYCEILEHILLPHLTALFGEGTPVLFMHNNASIYTTRMTQQWFADHLHIALPWQQCSPDLDPIEGVWAMMAREWQFCYSCEKNF